MVLRRVLRILARPFRRGVRIEESPRKKRRKLYERFKKLRKKRSFKRKENAPRASDEIKTPSGLFRIRGRCLTVDDDTVDSIFQEDGYVVGMTIKEEKETKKESTNSFTRACGGNFPVRKGPNYSKNKTKAPSEEALYELFNVDIFECRYQVEKFSDLAATIPYVDEPSFHPYVPFVLVVNCIVPLKPASMFSNDPDNENTLHVVYYFKLSEKTVHSLRDPANAPPAVRLLVDYCRNGVTDGELAGRLKAIGFLQNMNEVKIPGFLKSYNGKPVLLKNAVNVSMEENYMEISISVYKFTYVARKGFHFLKDMVHKLVIDMGFTIEACDDNEMPEQILGCVRLNRIDLESLVQFDHDKYERRHIKVFEEEGIELEIDDEFDDSYMEAEL